MNGTQNRDDEQHFDEGGALDPQEAMQLVEQTAMHARRQFDTASPVAALFGAGVFLFGYGAVWFSMLDQRVYTGPAGWSIALLYGLIVVAAIVGSLSSRRAVSGIGGRSRRQMQGMAVAVWAAGIGAWTVQGALRYLGVSFRIVYGVYGPTVPLIALAAAGAGFAAAREKWPELGLAIALIVVAAVSTFFGPLGAWGLTGVGSCVALLVYAAAVTARSRRPVALVA